MTYEREQLPLLSWVALQSLFLVLSFKTSPRNYKIPKALHRAPKF